MTEREPLDVPKKRRGRPPKPKQHARCAPDSYTCPALPGEKIRYRNVNRCEVCGKAIDETKPNRLA